MSEDNFFIKKNKRAALRRARSVSKAKRKYKISRYYCHAFQSADKYYGDGWFHDDGKELHRYSKNKIHCSCPLCNAKTNNKNRKVYYQPNYNPKASDIRKNDSMKQKELENNI